jgi:hypothetical protein
MFALLFCLQAKACIPNNTGEVRAEKAHPVILLLNSGEFLEYLLVEMLNYVIEFRGMEHPGAYVGSHNYPDGWLIPNEQFVWVSPEERNIGGVGGVLH